MKSWPLVNCFCRFSLFFDSKFVWSASGPVGGRGPLLGPTARSRSKSAGDYSVSHVAGEGPCGARRNTRRWPLRGAHFDSACARLIIWIFSPDEDECDCRETKFIERPHDSPVDTWWPSQKAVNCWLIETSKSCPSIIDRRPLLVRSQVKHKHKNLSTGRLLVICFRLSINGPQVRD